MSNAKAKTKRIKYNWWPDLRRAEARALLTREEHGCGYGGGWEFAGTQAELQSAGLWHPAFDELNTMAKQSKRITTTSGGWLECSALTSKTADGGRKRNGRYSLKVRPRDEWAFERAAQRRTLADCLKPLDAGWCSYFTHEAEQQAQEDAALAALAAFRRSTQPKPWERDSTNDDD